MRNKFSSSAHAVAALKGSFETADLNKKIVSIDFDLSLCTPVPRSSEIRRYTEGSLAITDKGLIRLNLNRVFTFNLDFNCRSYRNSLLILIAICKTLVTTDGSPTKSLRVM
jgi:hypothetical protein